MDVVGKEACIEARALNAKSCRVCDAAQPDYSHATPLAGAVTENLWAILTSLIVKCRELGNPRLRVSSMLALGRLLAHTSDTRRLDLKASSFAEYSLQCLRCSTRDLRIAATFVDKNKLKLEAANIS